MVYILFGLIRHNYELLYAVKSHQIIRLFFLNLTSQYRTMNSQFRLKIRSLKEQQKLYLRQVAAYLEIDTAQLSKIEKGVRHMKKEQVEKLAIIYKMEVTELEALWLADQVVDIVKDSKAALQALNVAGNQIKAI